MKGVVTVGLDIAKSVFQTYGLDAAGSVVFPSKLGRSEVIGFFDGFPNCLVGIEVGHMGNARPER